MLDTQLVNILKANPLKRPMTSRAWVSALLVAMLVTQAAAGHAKFRKHRTAARAFKHNSGPPASDLLRADHSFRDGTYIREMVDMSAVDSHPRILQEAIERKLGVISSSDVEDALGLAASGHNVNKDLLAIAVYISSQWGRLSSLDELKKELENGYVNAVYSGHDATIGDIMYYLYARKCNEGGSRFREVESLEGLESQMEPGDVLILDDITLQRVDVASISSKLDAARKRELARMHPDELVPEREEADYSLWAPYGWVGGLTSFSQSNLDKVVGGIAQRMAEAGETCPGDSGSSAWEDCVVHKALTNHPLWGGVALDEVYWVGETSASEVRDSGLDVSAQVIAERLAPDVDYEKLTESYELASGCLFEKPESDEDTVLKSGRLGPHGYLQYLMEFSTIVSMTRLAVYSRKVFGDIMNAFPDKDGEARIYCIPESAKSTNIVYHLWFMVTGEDPRRLFYCPSQDDQALDSAWAAVKSMASAENVRKFHILLVDDVSISGTQQQTAYLELVYIFNDVLLLPADVRACPLLYSETAVERFKGNNVLAFGGRLIRDSGVGSWMLGSNFDEGVAAIALPYMAPDNNNIFFAVHSAPAFTFKGCGVKGPSADQLENRSRFVPGCSMAGDPTLDEKVIKCVKTFRRGEMIKKEGYCTYDVVLNGWSS